MTKDEAHYELKRAVEVCVKLGRRPEFVVVGIDIHSALDAPVTYLTPVGQIKVLTNNLPWWRDKAVAGYSSDKPYRRPQGCCSCA